MKIRPFYDGLTKKTISWLFIFLTLHTVIQHVNAENIEIYASLLDNVFINCKVEFDSGSEFFHWVRGGKDIARGFYLMPDFQNDKFQIMVDQYKEEYTLKILNITKQDLGEYVCEAQIHNRVKTTNYILKLREYKSIASTEIISTQDTTTTGNSFFIQSTDSHIHRDFNNEKPNETGLFYRETLYYILPAVGSILVGCLAILCYARIHKKIRQGDGMEDYSNHYATINESGMLSLHELEAVADTTSQLKRSSSVSDKLYHEIIEDDVKQNISMEPGTDLIHLNHTGTRAGLKNMSLKTKFDSNTDNVPCPQVGNGGDKDESFDDGDDTACSNADDYLHPYTTLNVNDMEYLNSYSTVVNVD